MRQLNVKFVIMTTATKNIQWVVQSNLTNTENLQDLKTACDSIGARYTEVSIIPFSPQLPVFDIMPGNIYYGSTTFNNLLFNDERTKSGVFFNPVTFTIENYIKQWGKHMLNADAQVITFGKLVTKRYAADTLLFIRPDDDSKSFAGEVKPFSEIVKWVNQLESLGNEGLSGDTKVIVSKPYNIQTEWRLWIVNKRVIAASKYRTYFKLTKERGCPAEVVAFAEDRCREYTPHNVFVMDICLCGDSYYIVECGCMNGAGFYDADIGEIVESVSRYVIQGLY